MAERVVIGNAELWLGDCMDVLRALPDGKVHLSLYSPPFAGLYNYSSNDRDFSNCDNYDQFMEMYGFLVEELHRVTMPGRITGVHCMDVPSGNTGSDSLGPWGVLSRVDLNSFTSYGERTTLIAYRTVAVSDGKVHFFADLYGRDARLRDALAARKRLPAPSGSRENTL